MAKYALLIGVAEYRDGEGYPRLLTPLNDIEALRQVLLDPEKGGFDEVKLLPNPSPPEMEDAISTLFGGRQDNDITLLYFSGHGIKERRDFYLGTRDTRNNQQGNLLTLTAFPASRVHSIMSINSLKQQVVILDCCLSASFADGLLSNDEDSTNVKQQLKEKGRVILTSSVSNKPSFEKKGLPLSIYTGYLVEGIATGAADLDEDGVISIKNLHDYTTQKVQKAFPKMQQPEIYSVQPELLEIPIAKAPIRNPKLRYGKEVERLCKSGEISPVVRLQLDVLRDKLGLLPEDAEQIENEVLAPIREYKRKLQLFENYLREVVNRVLSE
ncbi:caspase family protein [Aerosakkonema funiforme]|uniref:caspase family protein n=1 Tax=Aerosakkonema funiforme TaxID=1246630 RepID=UPI0035BB4175